MSDNAPTLRLPTSPPLRPPTPPGRPPAPPGRPSRGPLVAFIVLAILVVAAIGLLVWVLTGRGGGGAQAIDTPRATLTTAPPASPAQPPRPSGTFTQFSAPSMQDCRGHKRDQHDEAAQVRWATANASQVWVAKGSTDAVSTGGEQVPLTGNQDSFPLPLPIDCNAGSDTFTMTLVGMDGAHVSRTWTVMISRHRG